MGDFYSLKIIDKFKFVYKRLGVDYDTMRIILKMKFVMDSRKVPTILENEKYDKNKNYFRKALMTNAFLGVLFMFFLFINTSVIFKMSIYFGIIMFFILSTFISDFSTVILDIRDKTLIGLTGVDIKTINIAKFTHILIYISKITLAFCGAALIASLKYGILFFIILLIELILIDILLVTITALVYFLILKYFDGEKLKDMINLIQIILSIVMIFGYQFFGQVIEKFNFAIEYKDKFINYFLPPMWFAAPLELIENAHVTIGLIILTIISIFMPILSLVIYIKNSRDFEEYLMKLNIIKDGNKKKSDNLNFKLSKVLCSDNIERAFYNFSCKMFRNERDLKLLIYPSLASGVIFSFLALYVNVQSAVELLGINILEINKIASVSKGYFSIYILVWIICEQVQVIKYSKEYKGAWIYKTTPINDYNKVYKGAIKAFMMQLAFPIISLESIIYLYIFRGEFLVHVLISICIMIIMTVINFRIMKVELPFSVCYEKDKNSNGLGTFLISTTILLLLIGGHYLSTNISKGIYIYLISMIIISILSWKRGFNYKK